MKNFPYKILFLCIFLPPICYILTVQGLEGYVQRSESYKINRILIKNQDAVYEGRYTIQDEISRNIGTYLSQSVKYRFGVRIHILVKTKDNQILYPLQFEHGLKGYDQKYGPRDSALESLNYMEVAEENYRILSKGLDLSVNVDIKHNSWLSNSILIAYVFLSLLFFRMVLKRKLKEAQEHEEVKQLQIERLSEQLNQASHKLKDVEFKESDYLKKIELLNKEKEGLSKDVDGLLEEMGKLEIGLKDQRELKEELEYEALQLQEDLDRIKAKTQKSKKKKKQVENIRKRFKVLYKRLVFTERALEGLKSLTGEFQLKAEEIVHKLNEDESQVSVKRKVFSKGGKANIFEVDFSYSGRIYFQKESNGKIRLVAIGTKNTQDQDLAYIESLQ